MLATLLLALTFFCAAVDSMSLGRHPMESNYIEYIRSENEVLKPSDAHDRKHYMGEDVVLEARYYQLSDAESLLPTRLGVASTTDSCHSVHHVPQELRYTLEPTGVPDHYQKYTEAYGIPVLGSSSVSDAALERACYVLRFLLADRESLRHAFFAAHGRVAVMAIDEKLRDLPELSFLPKLFDRSVRSLAATPALPVVAVGEENLLCEVADENRDEDLLVREIAISLMTIAAPLAQPKLAEEVRAMYEWAVGSGMWAETYAAVSPELYLGEGVQSFFNVNGFSQPPNGQHNDVKTRVALQTYDSGVFDIVTELFPCGNSIISRCSRRGREREKHQTLEMDCPPHRSRPTRGR